MRWDLRAIFRLATQDRVLTINPADTLFTPRIASPPSRRVLSAQDVRVLLAVLDLREQLIVRLALFSGMRPGEILALQWKHVADDHVDVMQRLYRGKLDRPKSERSKRKVALSSGTRQYFCSVSGPGFGALPVSTKSLSSGWAECCPQKHRP